MRILSTGMWRCPGAAEGIRTPDPRITNAVLYRLSYSGAGRDLEQNASNYAICGLNASHS